MVDDHADAAESFARVLRTLGCEATFITSPQLALDTAQEIEADIVFLDIGMPGLDGWDLARLFRAHYGWQGIRLIAVTAYGEEEHRLDSTRAGFDAHVVKPVPIGLIEEMMRSLFPGGYQGIAEPS